MMLQRNEWFNLGAKVNATEADHGIIAEGVAHPDLLDVILDKLCSSEYASCVAHDMPFTSHGSAFLQTVALAISPVG
jgi:hypothetical protein